MSIREALLRERYRGGQAFYVVPRIEDIAEVKSFLDKEVPEAKVAVAHGQMAAGQLEDVMTAFYEGKFDILLSTTIVESGLDIPTANTLIVHRADMFGLAQLYQLRGRVGRSKTRAYALFTVPANRTLTVAGRAAAQGAAIARHARRRLPARLATTSTSAAPATSSARSSPATSRRSATSSTSRCSRRRSRSSRPASRSRPRSNGRRPIAIGTPVMIPETYVPDLQLRLGLYRRLVDPRDAMPRSTPSGPR